MCAQEADREFYRPAVRPGLVLGGRSVGQSSQKQRVQETAERMLRHIGGGEGGGSLEMGTSGTVIKDMIREYRFRWFGHVMRQGEEDRIRNMLELIEGRQSKGKPKLITVQVQMLRKDLRTLKESCRGPCRYLTSHKKGSPPPPY